MADENQLSPVVCEKIFVFAVVFFLHYEQGCLQPFQAVLLCSKTNLHVLECAPVRMDLGTR